MGESLRERELRLREEREPPVAGQRSAAGELLLTAGTLAMLWAFYDLQSPASTLRLKAAELRDELRELRSACANVWHTIRDIRSLRRDL